jgi:hypothetical protein
MHVLNVYLISSHVISYNNNAPERDGNGECCRPQARENDSVAPSSYLKPKDLSDVSKEGESLVVDEERKEK